MEERVQRARRSLSGPGPRWLDTEEIGLDPATVDRICADSQWRVARAYPISVISWLLYVVPPGHSGILPVAAPRKQLSRTQKRTLLTRQLCVGALTLLTMYMIVHWRQWGVAATVVGVLLAVGISLGARPSHRSRTRQAEWIIELLQDGDGRYPLGATTIPRHTVRRLAADRGYDFLRTGLTRGGRYDVFVRRR